MKSAAPKTYISKRMLDRYSEQRSEQQKAKSNSMSGKSAPLVPPKSFTEDNSNSQSAAAQASPNLAVIEENKDEQLANTNANIAVAPQQEPAAEQQVK